MCERFFMFIMWSMKTFLSEVVESILEGANSLTNTICVLPSERAGIFLKQEFKKQIKTASFLPEILSVERFIERLSKLKKIDTLSLLFEFYSVYLQNNQMGKEDFDSFSQWAGVALQDFNELDCHLVSAPELFKNLKDIKRLEKWNLDIEQRASDVLENHFSFMERLGIYYQRFYEHLIKNKKGYQGLLYREAAKQVDTYIRENKSQKMVFIGFNALNKAEEQIICKFLERNMASVFWDSDNYYMNTTREAGHFLRKYKKEWTYFQNYPFQSIHNNFVKEKSIHQISASKNIFQIKAVGELLSKKNHLENTALVLADESLLPLTLNSLPENVKKLNITMGYLLKDMPIAGFFEALFQLYLNQEKLNKTTKNEFYYKDIQGLLSHPFLYRLLGTTVNIERLNEILVENNQVFISFIKICEWLPEQKEGGLFVELFNSSKNVSKFIFNSCQLMAANKNNFEGFEKECLYRYYNLFLQLENLNSDFNHIKSIKTLYGIYKQLISVEKLSFQGEPLSGLQVMGMLETRGIDFETVIITSMNEGILPAGKKGNSFIPFDVKKAYGLPTYQEKDAIYSYHFYRLIQRAKQVYLFYNTETDSYGSGEKSRFLTQLDIDDLQIVHKNSSAPVVSERQKPLKIEKTPEVIAHLKKIAESGFSPSALSTYVLDPIQYYKRYVLNIQDLDSIEETVDASTMGNVVHDVLDAFYKPLIGSFVKEEDIRQMISKTVQMTRYYFMKHYKNGDFESGKNNLILKVVENFVLNFLNLELQLLKRGAQLKILGVEIAINVPFQIEGFDFPIQIKGKVDRIDELDGVVRVIDYKTGMVEKNQLKISKFEKITEDYKYTKAMQVMLYTFLYTQQNRDMFKNSLEAGIFSFRNMKSGFIKMNFSEERSGCDTVITEERVSEFMKTIKGMLSEIFDVNTPFIENNSLPFKQDLWKL